MPFVVTCPKCAARYSAPDNLMGQSVQCPSCQVSFVAGSEQPQGVPTRSGANVAASAAVAAPSRPTKPVAQPATFKTSCSHCHKSFAAPSNLQGQMVRCPSCGQSFTAMPASKDKPGGSGAATMPTKADWKWFEENFEPYKPPKVEKEERSRPQIKLPNIIIGEMKEPLRLAGRGTRLAAALVDNVLVMGIPMLLYLVAVGEVIKKQQAGEELSEMARKELLLTLSIVGGILLVIGIINLILLALRGQTIGKAMLGIKIVGTDGHPCFARILFIRILLMGLLSNIPFVALIDVLLIFRESRQCLHDQLADTIVVRAR